MYLNVSFLILKKIFTHTHTKNIGVACTFLAQITLCPNVPLYSSTCFLVKKQAENNMLQHASNIILVTHQRLEGRQLNSYSCLPECFTNFWHFGF